MDDRRPYSALQLRLIDALEAFQQPELSEINDYIDLIRATYIPEDHYLQVQTFIKLLLFDAMPDLKSNPNDLKLNLLWQDCEVQLSNPKPSSRPL